MEQCLRNAQVRRGTDWQEFSKPLNNSKHHGQQIVVQASSRK